jgi:hypothetical protein
MFSSVRVLGVAGVLALADSAGAMGAVGDHFDPDRVSVVGPTHATSTCIGDPRTPECALDTLFACAVRRDPELCRRVGIGKTCFDPLILDARYKIEKVRLISEENLPAYLKSQKRADDVFVNILYDSILCRPSHMPCTRFRAESARTLKSSGQGWMFTSIPREADQCEPDSKDD